MGDDVGLSRQMIWGLADPVDVGEVAEFWLPLLGVATAPLFVEEPARRRFVEKKNTHTTFVPESKRNAVCIGARTTLRYTPQRKQVSKTVSIEKSIHSRTNWERRAKDERREKKQTL